jgi:hypothetical protein
MTRVEVKERRWRRVEYERMIECGFFQTGEPIELVGGQIVVAEPQGSRHLAHRARGARPACGTPSA